MVNYFRLDISGIAVEELEFSEFCTDLKWIYADDNRLRRIKFNGNSFGQLNSLSLGNNQISEWPFAEESCPPELMSLGLASNLIESFPAGALDGCQSLRSLDLSDNRISAATISMHQQISELRYVNLSGNSIKGISFSGKYPTLAVLDISRNQLESIDGHLLGKLPSLQSLYLSENGGVVVNLDSQRQMNAGDGIERFDMSSSLLTEIPDLSSMCGLKTLKLERNLLTAVDGRRLPNGLREMNFAHNKIREIGNFSPTQLTSLEEMDLTENPLRCDCSLAQTFDRWSNQINVVRDNNISREDASNSGPE